MINKIFVLDSIPLNEKQTGEDLYKDVIRNYGEYYKSNIEHHFFKVNSKQEFFDRLNGIYSSLEPDDEAIIHIEGHGDNQLFELLNKEVVSWDELRNCLVRINRKIRNKLHLNLATCFGMHIAVKISLTDTSPYKSYISALNELKPIDIGRDNSIIYEEVMKCKEMYPAFIEFTERSPTTTLRIKDIETVLDFILGLQIDRTLSKFPNYDLKTFYDVFLNININNEDLKNAKVKAQYVKDLFFDRFLMRNV